MSDKKTGKITELKNKKAQEPQFPGCFHYGRGTRTRTQIDGFGVHNSCNNCTHRNVSK